MKSFFLNYQLRRQVMTKIRNSVKVLKDLAIAASENNDYNSKVHGPPCDWHGQDKACIYAYGLLLVLGKICNAVKIIYKLVNVTCCNCYNTGSCILSLTVNTLLTLRLMLRCK